MIIIITIIQMTIHSVSLLIYNVSQKLYPFCF